MIKLGSTTINKIRLGSTSINKVFLGANQVYPMGGGGGGPGANVESFDTLTGTNPWTGDLSWTDPTSDPDFSLALSALHVTEGSNSWKATSTSTNAVSISSGTLAGSANINLTGFSSLLVDVYVESVFDGNGARIEVIDSGFNFFSDQTPDDATGAFTLNVDISSSSGLGNVLISLGHSGNNTNMDYVFYWDNLRAE